jgi:hypothetical protein
MKNRYRRVLYNNDGDEHCARDLRPPMLQYYTIQNTLVIIQSRRLARGGFMVTRTGRRGAIMGRRFKDRLCVFVLFEKQEIKWIGVDLI